MKKIILLAAFLLVGYLGHSQVYRISIEGPGTFVLKDTTDTIKSRYPFPKGNVQASKVSSEKIMIYVVGVTPTATRYQGVPVSGIHYTDFVDENNETFDSADEIEEWFTTNCFNTAGGTASPTDSQTSYEDETWAYYNRVIDAGGVVKTSDLDALDNFVKSGKLEGWWDNVMEFTPALGKDLTTALQKFYTVTSTDALINNGVLESDYNEVDGFMLDAIVDARHLQTGFIPANHGMTYTSASLSIVTSNLKFLASPVFGNTVSDNPASEGPKLKGPGYTNVGNTGGNTGIYEGASTVNVGSSLVQSYINGVIQEDKAISGAAYTFNTEITVFKSTSFGTAYYKGGNFSGYLFTTGLSKEEARLMNVALTKLYINVGRLKYRGAIGVFGDSITYGQGASEFGEAFIAQLSKLTGKPVMRWDASSSKIYNPSATGVASLYERYLNAEPLMDYVETVIIYYGTNDMSADVNDGTPATITAARTRLETVINWLKSYNKKVIVFSPLTRETIYPKFALWNEGIKLAAQNTNVPFINGFEQSSNISDVGDLLADTVHPNTAGHRWIAELMAKNMGQVEYTEKVRNLTASRNINALDVNSTVSCSTSSTLTITLDFDAMLLNDFINLESKGVTLTITGASGVSINGSDAGSVVLGDDSAYTGGVLRKTGTNSYVIF